MPDMKSYRALDIAGEFCPEGLSHVRPWVLDAILAACAEQKAADEARTKNLTEKLGEAAEFASNMTRVLAALGMNLEQVIPRPNHKAATDINIEVAQNWHVKSSKLALQWRNALST